MRLRTLPLGHRRCDGGRILTARRNVWVSFGSPTLPDQLGRRQAKPHANRAEMTNDHPTVLDAFNEHHSAEPNAAAVHYFGNRITRAQLHELSNDVAYWLSRAKVTYGDRVAVSLQNTPVFAAAMLATWKLGAVLVPINPMLKTGELATLLADCEPKVVLAHPEMADVVSAAVKHVERPPTLAWSSRCDLAGDIAGLRADNPVETDPVEGTWLLAELRPSDTSTWTTHTPAPDDLALLAYTSGTTGPSKGAMITHKNLAYQATVTPQWLGLAAIDSVLTIAPFFHITGLGMHLALGLGTGLPLIMTYRFEPERVLALAQRYSPTFTVGTITAYIALAEHAAGNHVARTALKTLAMPISGGAAVPAAVVDRYEQEFGQYIRNGYGLTETTSVCIAVPAGQKAPVDTGSGATSIGKPLPGVEVTIIADDGSIAPNGVGGEIVLRGTQVASAYWNRPDETANAFQDDGLHTGDIGIIDDNGWIYLIDRKKDLIVVSGYKVWPRDVEDTLYRHQAVAEAAVIGVPDEYRGESVRAYIVPRAGATVSPEELNRHCRELLSVYKCPRHYEIVDSLPKSASGKILRRTLRAGT